MRTEFFEAMIPPTCTHQQKKITAKDGKVVVYESPPLKRARAKLEAHLSKHVPDTKYSGGVWLGVKWCFPLSGDHKDGEYMTEKPDLDNLQKLLLDVMTTLGYWKDDKWIASMMVEKFWAKLPGIYIAIASLGEKNETDPD